jgi:hypothetical protein
MIYYTRRPHKGANRIEESMSKTPEGAVLKAVLDYLAARHILAFRMPVGAVKMDDKRFMRFGTPGMADVLAFPLEDRWKSDNYNDCAFYLGQFPAPPVWIECKAPKGKQSEFQKSFQAQVEEAGHRYGICRSIEDVEALLK